MTPQEFGPEISRLFEGWKRESELTTPMLESYWEKYGSLPLETWRTAVTRALRLPNGFPWDNQLERLIDEIEQENQTRKAHEVRGRGQGGSYAQTLEVAAGPATMRSHHARFYMLIISGELAGQTPAQVAATLEEQSWPSQLSGDIERLNAAPDWRSFHIANAPPRDREQYQPRQKPVQQETLRWDQQ